MIDHTFLMTMAIMVGTRSTCDRLHVGAVLTLDRRIISMGYNGAPSGIDHCHHSVEDSGGCKKAVHAEANTIAFAAKAGVSTRESILYTTHSPCYNCATIIINSGVKGVLYLVQYRAPEGLNLLEGSGVFASRLKEPELQSLLPPPRHGSSLPDRKPSIDQLFAQLRSAGGSAGSERGGDGSSSERASGAASLGPPRHVRLRSEPVPGDERRKMPPP